MKDKTNIVIQEVFYALGLALVIFTAMELIRPRIVLAYINLNVLVALFFVSGIMIIVKKSKIKM